MPLPTSLAWYRHKYAGIHNKHTDSMTFYYWDVPFCGCSNVYKKLNCHRDCTTLCAIEYFAMSLKVTKA